MLYLSLHQGGGVFLWFQWDALLLETGFLAFFLAPLEPLLLLPPAPRPWDRLKLWVVRWLAFRLVFCSGAVKLSAGCPTWWGLTALQTHFESQCIPSQLGWALHQLPEWVLRVSVVLTFFTEVASPLLFLAPSRLLRLVAFLFQCLLVLGINLSGNYNFFGILTLAASFALLDDGLLSAGGGLARVRVPLQTGKRLKSAAVPGPASAPAGLADVVRGALHLSARALGGPADQQTPAQRVYRPRSPQEPPRASRVRPRLSLPLPLQGRGRGLVVEGEEGGVRASPHTGPQDRGGVPEERRNVE